MSSGPLFRGNNLQASEEEEDDDHQQVSCFICSSSSNGKSNKYSSRNPYSARGLDKFSALLADLEEKRRMIYSQIGSQDIFVRFVYPSGSDDVKPIVVMMTNNDSAQKKPQARPEDMSGEAVHNNPDGPCRILTRCETRPEESGAMMQKSLSKFSWNSGGGVVERFGPGWNRVRSGFRKFLRNPSSYYMMAAVVLVVLLLAIFGRTVGVACACVGWYVLPTVRIGSNSMKVMKNKKTYLRKLSEHKKVANEELPSSPKLKNQQRTRK